MVVWAADLFGLTLDLTWYRIITSAFLVDIFLRCLPVLVEHHAEEAVPECKENDIADHVPV